MAIPSNLYAEKIFSEHPIALWSLDEQVDYISLINNNVRDFKTWNKSSNEIFLSDALNANEPFPQAPATLVTATSATLTEITLTKQSAFKAFNLNSELQTFSIGAYFYSNSPSISGVSIGYTYNGLQTPFIKNIQTEVTGRWFFVSEVFDVPQTNEDVDVFIKIRFDRIEDVGSYSFVLNGLSVGQWSENFSSTSLGIENLIDLPNNIEGISNFKAIPSKAYGLSSLNGYYLSKNGKLLAKNTSLPLVYGAQNLTALYPNNNLPSLIIPGLGFLNESGKFREYTAEFWIRINSNTEVERKVFGPIASNDGLYVNGPFLTLKIDQQSQSYFVHDWYRPMLIDIRYISGSVNLLINGERVISFDIRNQDILFPSFLSENLNREQDWLGFYAYEDVPQVEIDCVAIYPYSVPEVVAKRRFVYGQGVEYPENINTAYNGTSVYIDYQFANYANNYLYPDMGRWNQGAIENLLADNNSLSMPDYPLPKIITQNNESEILLSSQTGNDYFTFYPNSNWNELNSYLVFENLDFIKTRIESIYGIFETGQNVQARQNLITILDPLTNNSLSIYISNGQIKYDFVFNDSLTTIEDPEYKSLVIPNAKLRAGVTFKEISKKIGRQASIFLNNVDRCQVYIGGTKNLTQTFYGKIYSIGIANERTLYEIKSLFNKSGILENYENVFLDYQNSTVFYDGGTPQSTSWPVSLNSSNEYGPLSFTEINIDSFVPTYKLLPTRRYENFLLDVAASGYWQDYLPLTYFGKYITDGLGKQVYSLDFIQANVSYPILEKFKTVNGKEYFDTDQGFSKFYVSFHDNQSRTISKINNRETVLLETNKIITPEQDWRLKKYEFVDGTIIYPPKGIDFNLVSISFHIELKNNSVTTKPLKIKKLSLGSLALSKTVPSKIGTKFGSDLYPYKKLNPFYVDYKTNTPFEIYRNSSPYLYLTKNSGIRMLDTKEQKGLYEDAGLEIPINSGAAENFKMIAFQSAIFYNEKNFPEEPVKIFEIKSNTSLTKIYLQSSQENNQRAKIYAIDAYTGARQRGIIYYVNGNPSLNPSVNIHEWATLGINFGSILDFANSPGHIRISGPLVVNNLSYYQLDDLQVLKRPLNRIWAEVKSSLGIDLKWQAWFDNFTWGEVLIISADNQYEINGKDIYNSFVGTNKIIIDDTQIGEDLYNTNSFNLNSFEYNVITGALLESKTLKAV
jgi:hypothetical protein